MKRFTLSLLLGALALSAALGAGCRGQTSGAAPIVPIRNMHDQQRYDPQSASALFADGRTMRMPVSGTVPREHVLDPEIGSGRMPDDSGYVLELPQPVVDRAGGMASLIERGQNRYNVYCVPCHDGSGYGKGTVITRSGWQPAPPSLHEARLRQMPDGQLFATITNGVRIMPAYGPQIPVQDRWAIVSYVRALQLSQGE